MAMTKKQTERLDRILSGKPEYPEHDKLSKISPVSQEIGSFMEWLSSQGVRMPSTWYRRSIQEWLARYFKIDLVKLENKKRDMLDKLRREN